MLCTGHRPWARPPPFSVASVTFAPVSGSPAGVSPVTLVYVPVPAPSGLEVTWHEPSRAAPCRQAFTSPHQAAQLSVPVSRPVLS